MIDFVTKSKMVDLIVLVVWIVVFATMGSVGDLLPNFIFLIWALLGLAYLIFGRRLVLHQLYEMEVGKIEDKIKILKSKRDKGDSK